MWRAVPSRVTCQRHTLPRGSAIGNITCTTHKPLPVRTTLGVYSPSLWYQHEVVFVESVVIDMGTLIGSGTVVLIVGLGIGVLFGLRTSPGGQRYRDVESKLDQTLQDKKGYEDEVVEHFTDTAKLLNNLTESYRDVHDHLAKGAATLCQGEGPVSLDRLDDGRNMAEIPAALADIHPPLDYAPKTSPDEKGMLNEEFGLERKPTESSPESPEEPKKPDSL
ncbi:MAG TPA: DUF1043 family protein [Halieaceae bacterium]|nr:DUF1043 family protein [Halieaceae bacterium]